jgi:hypothetical protein
MCVCWAQDRFTSLVPALTKYGATTVGVTLLVIGVAGLYETLTEGGELATEAQPALAGVKCPEKPYESQAAPAVLQAHVSTSFEDANTYSK